MRVYGDVDGVDVTKGASVIYGDSLVNAGNNNYLPTPSRANIRPNGIAFKAFEGTPTVRYANGRTVGDIVGLSCSFCAGFKYYL